MKIYIKFMSIVSLLIHANSMISQEFKSVVSFNNEDIYKLYDRDYSGVQSAFNMLNKEHLLDQSFNQFIEEHLDEKKTNYLNLIHQAIDIIFSVIDLRIQEILSDDNIAFEELSHDPVLTTVSSHQFPKDYLFKQELKKIYDRPSTSNGLSKIQLAVKQGNVKNTKLLQHLGANIHVQDADGNSLLHLAVLEQNKLTKNYQLSHHHDDYVQFQLEQIAAKSSQFDTIALFLLEAGLDPNIYNELGQTALHLVALHNNNAMAKILLDHGADFKLLDHGKSAIQIANQMRNDHVVIELKNHGATLRGRKRSYNL